MGSSRVPGFNRVWLTLAFSCGARSAFELKGKCYLRKTLSRRQLQGFVRHRRVLGRKRFYGRQLLVFNTTPNQSPK
jgi:hypothetical protein